MSEPRTVDQIRIEYSQGCAKAGQLQYQIVTLQKDLDLLNSSLRDLNNEAALLIQAEKKEEPKNA